MTVLIVLGSVLAFLFLVAMIRVGVSAEYAEDGISVRAHIGPVRVQLYPAVKKKVKKAEKKAEKKAAEQAQKPGVFKQLKEQLPEIKKALSRLKRKLLIKELTIYYIAAGPDPAQAALTFGGVSAGYGIVAAVLENNFRIKKRDLRAAVDFEAEEPYIYVRARLSLAVWEALYVADGLILSMARAMKPQPKPAADSKPN